MPWDNSVNKNGIIYADHTTLDVRNMPLTILSGGFRLRKLARKSGFHSLYTAGIS